MLVRRKGGLSPCRFLTRKALVPGRWGGYYQSLVGHLLLLPHPTARSSSELAAALGGRVPSSITPILQMRKQSLGVGKPHSQVPPERVTGGPGGVLIGQEEGSVLWRP